MGVIENRINDVEHSLTRFRDLTMRLADYAAQAARTAGSKATSPAAQRFVIKGVLVVVVSLFLLLVAAVAYPIFYYNYVPKKVVEVPVHLQYNAGPNPYGLVTLDKRFMSETTYDITVEIVLPRSPPNLSRGNFMVALFALRSSLENPAQSFTISVNPYSQLTLDNVVFSARRPALVPYADPLVAQASRLLFLPWHVLQPVGRTEQTNLRIPMGEMVEFRKYMPLTLLLDVQSGQDLQVYSVTLAFVARLTGLRWAMYNYRIISFVVGTFVFWVAELVSMAVAGFLVTVVLLGGGGQDAESTKSMSNDSDGRGGGTRAGGKRQGARRPAPAATSARIKAEPEEQSAGAANIKQESEHEVDDKNTVPSQMKGEELEEEEEEETDKRKTKKEEPDQDDPFQSDDENWVNPTASMRDKGGSGMAEGSGTGASFPQGQGKIGQGPRRRHSQVSFQS